MTAQISFPKHTTLLPLYWTISQILKLVCFSNYLVKRVKLHLLKPINVPAEKDLLICLEVLTEQSRTSKNFFGTLQSTMVYISDQHLTLKQDQD